MERLTEYESIGGHAHAIPVVSDMDAIMMRLAAYEDTGLTPEQCKNLKFVIESAFSIDISRAERIPGLLKADRDGRVMVLPAIRCCEQYGWQNITWDEKYGVCAGSWNTREEAEKALEMTKNGN